MRVAVIGVGLIGGSMILDLRRRGIVQHVIGIDHNSVYLKRARQLRIIDEEMPLQQGIKDVDIVILSVPVLAASTMLSDLLHRVDARTLVMDVGSTKSGICKAVAHHPHRKQYVACHPIAGTEFSGPDAAHEGLFKGKINIICNREQSDADKVTAASAYFEALGMSNIFMEAEEHDRHIAYVSHLSHITSFTLGLTVLEREKDEKHIFNMAGSGFASTVRLAKSSSAMWTPIFEQNKENLMKALEAYQGQLQVFKKAIEADEWDNISNMIEKGNDISRILEGMELRQRNHQ